MRFSLSALQLTPRLGSTPAGAKTTLSSAARVAADRVVGDLYVSASGTLIRVVHLSYRPQA